jgi:type I restriction-modification system DNA methylase subunit/restriction endonuclease S subunit
MEFAERKVTRDLLIKMAAANNVVVKKTDLRDVLISKLRDAGFQRYDPAGPSTISVPPTVPIAQIIQPTQMPGLLRPASDQAPRPAVKRPVILTQSSSIIVPIQILTPIVEDDGLKALTIPKLRERGDATGKPVPKSVKKKDDIIAFLRGNGGASSSSSGDDDITNDMWRARDILRKIGITDFTALNIINMFVILRELEKIFGDSLCTRDDYEDLDEDDEDNIKTYMLFDKYMKFSRLTEELHGTVPKIGVTILVLQTLQKHRVIGQSLLSIDPSHIFHSFTDERVAGELMKFIRDNMPFAETSDSMGNAFESIITNQKGGDSAALGQHFTPREFVNYTLAQAVIGRSFGHVLDPTCGTGGFLVRCHSAESVTGYEISNDLVPIAQANYMINIHKGCRINRLDFLRDAKILTDKFDTIVSNPPFGVKGIDWKELKDCVGENVYPLKTSATFFFVQKIIYHLKVGGRACIVFPLGSELSGKGKGDMEFRQALLASCHLRSITVFPSGIFKNTGVKTCLLVFDKVRELYQVIGKKGRSTAIADILPQHTELFQLNADMSQGCIDATNEFIDEAMFTAKGFSMLPSDYGVTIEMKPMEGCEMKRLGDLCTFIKGTFNAKDMTNNGNVPFYSGKANNPVGYNDTHCFDYDEYLILIKDGGSGSGKYGDDIGLGKCFYVNGKSAATGHLIAIRVKNRETIDTKYLYYYLRSIKDKIMDLAHYTTGLGTIRMDCINEIQIAVPSIERQREIISELDVMENCIRHADSFCKLEGSQIKKIIMLSFIQNMSTHPIKNFCSFKRGKIITKANLVPGPYFVIGGGISPMGTHNEYNMEKNAILISQSGANAGFISKYDSEVWASDCFSVVSNNETELVNDYLYYYLSHIQKKIMSMSHGAAQPHFNVSDAETLNIIVPPIEIQMDIVKSLKEIDTMIQIKLSLIDTCKDTMIRLFSFQKREENIETNNISNVIDNNIFKMKDDLIANIEAYSAHLGKLSMGEKYTCNSHITLEIVFDEYVDINDEFLIDVEQSVGEFFEDLKVKYIFIQNVAYELNGMIMKVICVLNSEEELRTHFRRYIEDSLTPEEKTKLSTHPFPKDIELPNDRVEQLVRSKMCLPKNELDIIIIDMITGRYQYPSLISS